MNDTLLLAVALTLFAGLSTGIGSAMAFFAKRTSRNFLSASLGLSAGVMIYISFVEMLPDPPAGHWPLSRSLDGKGWKNVHGCASYGCCGTCLSVCPVGIT